MAFDKLGRFFGVSKEDEFDENDLVEEEFSAQAPVNTLNEGGRKNNLVSINPSLAGKSQIVIFEPRVYSDAKELAQNLLNNKAVLINFSRMDDDSARRIVDFITGTVYALNGEIQKVGDKIFLATSPKFQTDGRISDLSDKKDNLG